MDKRYNYGYDIIRIIAAYMVVVIHSGVIFFASHQKNINWFVGMEISSLCLVAVPLFFMTSGALLLEKGRILTKQQYKRRFLKQLIPFVSWSFVYLLARAALGKTDISIETVLGLAKEPAYYQFWFMYSLLAIYLLLPILEIIVQNSSKRRIEYILILWLLFSVIQPTLAEIIPLFSISHHVDLVLCEGYVGFFILGYYLREFGCVVSKKKTLFLMVAGVVMILLQAGLEYAVSAEHYQGYFYRTYLTPGVVLGSVGVFLFFQNADWKANRCVKRLSELTLGIFYIHMLVLTAFEYVGFTGAYNLGLCGVKSVGVFVISGIGIAIMSKFKVLNKLFLGKK